MCARHFPSRSPSALWCRPSSFWTDWAPSGLSDGDGGATQTQRLGFGLWSSGFGVNASGQTYNFAMLYLPCRITSRKFLSKLQRASRPEANSAMALRLTLSLLTALVAAEPVLFEPNPFAGGQLRGQAEDIDPFGGVEEPGRSDKWLRDISTRTKNHFKKLLQPLQTPIVQEYQVLTILDGYVNYTMQLVSNATGHEVVWNRTGRFLSEEPRALAPRKQELPPRARYINKILIYLNKEMEVVWNLKTIVDRKRWGVGNVITSSPYGPHGEHPERWRANGSFPLPAAAPNNTILLQDGTMLS